jgi:large subunit ribosomal protein L18e
MVKRTGPTNTILKKLIEELKKKSLEENVKIWKRVAEILERPTRKRVEINLKHIEREAKDGETIVVPGVVLSEGELKKKVTISAWRFSAKAKEKIVKVGGRAISIEELIKENPKGSNVRIMV